MLSLLSAWWLWDRPASVAQAAFRDHGRWLRNEDGDTFDIETALHGRQRVRLHAVDTPERVQAHGAAAGDALTALLRDARIEIDCYKRDARDRAVCRVSADGRDVQLALLEQGLAWHYRAFADEQTREEMRSYRAAEKQAQAQRRGLWRDADPLPPWECRSRLRALQTC